MSIGQHGLPRAARVGERHSVWAVTEAEAVEILSAHGFYREGTPPDPMWLLQVAAHDRLNWGRERRLTRASWYERELEPYRPVNGIWPDRQAALHQFLSVRRDARLASACLETWCQFWPGDQGNTRHSPTAAALAHFMWHMAPLQFRAAGSAPLEVMASWFRFLAERYRSCGRPIGSTWCFASCRRPMLIGCRRCPPPQTRMA